MLTRDDIVAVCPPPKAGTVRRGVWDGYVNALTSPEGARLLKSYGIDTPLRLVHLLATFAAETGLTVLWESGSYSAQGIMRVFGVGKHSAKITIGEASQIASLPVEERTKVLFERVYGIGGNPRKARELGNTEYGDGWKYRGLGLNQMTGRWAHENAAKEIGCRVDELAKPINCIHMALVEWDEKSLNDYADRDDAVSIRKLINAGSLKVPVSRINGLPDALAAVKRAKAVITAGDFENEPVANVAPAIGPPPTIVHSTESQAAAGVGMAGGWQVQTEMSSAMAAMSASGQPFSIQAFAMQIMSSPGFWLAAFTVLGAAYWWFKRRARLYLDGV